MPITHTKHKREGKNCTIIFDTDAHDTLRLYCFDYRLTQFDIGNVYAMEKIPNAAIPKNMQTATYITGRTFAECQAFFKKPLPNDPKLSYIEFGPGFGGLTPHYANLVQDPTKIVAIDRHDYAATKKLLEYALNLPFQYCKPKIEEVRNNIFTITDPTKVTLINSTLGEAVEQHKDLEHKFDVAIDVGGVFAYCDIEIPSRQWLIEQNKKDGMNIE
jgi:hypothetical protein